MSLPRQAVVVCPACNRSCSIVVWETVNVTLQPNLRTRVMDRSLHSAKCSHCSTLFEFFAELFYHDMNRKFMISLVKDEPGKPFIVHPFSATMAKQMPEHILRFVTSYNQLVEKIQIFESGLNDWVIETLKFFLWHKKFPGRVLGNDQMYFNGIEDEGTREPKLRFDCFEQGKSLGRLCPSRTLYEAMWQAGEEKYKRLEIDGWQLVNQSNIFSGKDETSEKD